MTPSSQRIAIAEACGWHHIERRYNEFDLGGYTPDGIPGRCVVPDYLNDLNAMHEAEKVLTEKQRTFYLANICLAQGRQCETKPDWNKGDCLKAAVSATAAQRAEAFLRTLNLWTT